MSSLGSLALMPFPFPSLPCSRCGSLRLVFPDAIRCPSCDSVELGDADSCIKALGKQLSEALVRLQHLLSWSNYDQVFDKALEAREKSAAGLLRSPTNIHHARNFITASYLLTRLAPSNVENAPVTFEELFYTCEHVVDLYDKLESLKERRRMILADQKHVPR